MRSEHSPRGNPPEPNRPLSARKESPPSKLFKNNREWEMRFVDMVKKHSEDLTHYVHSLGAGNDSEDVVQETLLKVGIKMAENRVYPDVDVKGYLYAAARNTSFKREAAKKARPIEVDEESATNIGIPSHEKAVLDRIVVRSALSEVPDKQKEALFLTHYEGLNIPEISEKKDMPEGTVRSRRHYGIISMRKELRKIGQGGEE